MRFVWQAYDDFLPRFSFRQRQQRAFAAANAVSSEYFSFFILFAKNLRSSGSLLIFAYRPLFLPLSSCFL
jgi:hypothetical protein